MHHSTCPVCGKRMPHYWTYCSHTCREIASGKLRPVTIAEVLGAKR
jgi:predicted nucleic acid-binding Zn ribbon protein